MNFVKSELNALDSITWERKAIPMRIVLSTLTAITLTTGITLLATPARSEILGNNWQIAQDSNRAERTCTEAVEDEGYRVNDILDTNIFSGGAEVVMEVSRRGNTKVVGCDYSNNSRDVELYELEGYNDDDDRYGLSNNDDDSWQNQFYDSDGVNDRGYAEDIAREVVGQQLGIDDPYSDIVEIDEVRRESNDRNWVVEGKANGAAFVVRIRADDAYITEFSVY